MDIYLDLFRVTDTTPNSPDKAEILTLVKPAFDYENRWNITVLASA